MPVDMPPNKKPVLSTEATVNLLLDRSLNWLAVVTVQVVDHEGSGAAIDDQRLIAFDRAR